MEGELERHCAVLNHVDNSYESWFTVHLEADGTDIHLI